MNGLAAALAKAGVVSREAAKESEARISNKLTGETGSALGKLKGKASATSLMNLEKIKTVSEFKEVAKKILLEDSSAATITEIVRLGHGVKELDGGKKLIWLILSLREKLPKVKPDKKEQVTKRALRSANPTVDIPSEWLL